MKKPEILAPAGSMEHFKAAVENGADAVYFGGKSFNARQYAENFSYEEMERAVKYAHGKNIRVYMTVNTLIKDSELQNAVLMVEDGIKAGVDAYIIQDLGLAYVLKKKYPEIRLHMSTQGTVYDEAGVIFASKLGFSRVVLARESGIEVIKKCADCAGKCGIETEVFVHGALCMCLSGQCSMSSLIGTRSGNRGSCAQPCRKWYSLERGDGSLIGEQGYLLSPKDISYLPELKEICMTGVDSLKIEGRMKQPEYAAVTSGVFRKYLDEIFDSGKDIIIDHGDSEKLEQVFSRGGFTKGYLYGKQNAAILSGDSPKHKGLFAGTVRNVRKSAVSPDKKLIEVDLRQNIAVGDGVEIICRGFPGGIVSFIRGKAGNVRIGEAGQKYWIGDFPGNIKPGNLVYKVSDKKLLDEIRKSYVRAEIDKRYIYGCFKAETGKVITYTVTDGMGNSASANGTILIETAENNAVKREDILKKLSKTGDTPYTLADCTIDITDDLMIPMSEINKVRRSAMEKLQNEE